MKVIVGIEREFFMVINIGISVEGRLGLLWFFATGFFVTGVLP